MLSGAIGVLPDASFLKLCKTNITAIDTAATEMSTLYSTADYTGTLESLQALLEGAAGTTFSCFYSVKDPAGLGASSNEDLVFGPILIAWNVLYNLGYMYTDIVTINQQRNAVSPITPDHTIIATRLGDFIMRFFYSRYLE